MSENAWRTNLRKLSFLGFAQKNDGSSNGGEVQLDEECAKVFAMDNDTTTGFDIHKFHEGQQPGMPKYSEKDYMQHRKKSYPHMPVPLKISSRSMKRRPSQQETPNSTPPYGTPREGNISPISTVTGPPSVPSATPLPSLRSKLAGGDSDLLSSMTLQEEDDLVADSSESECVLSDPCGCLSPDTDFSPEKHVQFSSNSHAGDDQPAAGHTVEKKRRRHHHQTPKYRKFSLPEDPARRRHHHNHHPRGGPQRRTTRVPYDEEPLKDEVREQVENHRNEDPRGIRRHRAHRPPPAIVHVGWRTGGNQDVQGAVKKMYDRSPHAIFVELSELFTGSASDREWKETARWIKYEEDVEEGVDRWGKPHVASLSFHSLLNLRRCLEDGLVILDLEERDLPAIAYRVSEDLYREELIREEDKGRIMRILLLRHRHVKEHHDRFRFSKKYSYTSLQSLWQDDGGTVNIGNCEPEARMAARSSVCSQGQIYPPRPPMPRRPSFPHNLHDVEKRKISFSNDIRQKNGGRIDQDGHLVTPADNHTVVDMKEETYSTSAEDMRKPSNDGILKRIPADAQGSCVLVGEVDTMEQPAIAFVRLAEGVVIPSLIEVNIPVRFIFILLGPRVANLDYHEVGRSISTLMANHQFHNIAYSADNRKALLSAINEFLDDSIVLPPGDWERQALLPIEEIKAKSEAIRKRKENALKKAAEAQGLLIHSVPAGDGDGKKPPRNPLKRTKRPWGGLINDVKYRYPLYKTDFLDGLNAQSIAAAIFMYFAALSGAVAFGGLMSDKTENLIGIPETLMCTSVAGIFFALCSGQPLVIVGVTGPLLLFDESLYQFCVSSGFEFLTTRVFIGIWLCTIGVVVACFEGSVLVKLFTRFTEDIFSALIVLLYIIESVMKLIFVFGRHPLLPNNCGFIQFVDSNNSYLLYGDFQNNTHTINSSDASGLTDVMFGTPMVHVVPTKDDNGPINQPNTALFCTILTLGTFAIAYYLKMFRNSQFLGRSARRALGDFGVPIAIVVMVFVDYMVPQTYTEKLDVPEGLTPSSSEEREWFIPPGGKKDPFPIWLMFAAAVPAMLVYILLFMETHITELIIDKKERKLTKGSGFHLDIVLVCVCNVVSGLFGLPWVCAATVRSIAHVSALTVMSRTHAPGEKSYLIEVKEQRISALTVAVLIGVSVFMAPLLRLVPMAVLFGVFLYMGAASTDGIQFFDRVKLLFMPVKHHPQACYVRKVKTLKMHLFTIIQLLCLILLWIVKYTKASLAFPFFLILMVPLRAQLKYLFSSGELRAELWLVGRSAMAYRRLHKIPHEEEEVAREFIARSLCPSAAVVVVTDA